MTDAAIGRDRHPLNECDAGVRNTSGRAHFSGDRRRPSRRGSGAGLSPRGNRVGAGRDSCPREDRRCPDGPPHHSTRWFRLCPPRPRPAWARGPAGEVAQPDSRESTLSTRTPPGLMAPTWRLVLSVRLSRKGRSQDVRGATHGRIAFNPGRDPAAIMPDAAPTGTEARRIGPIEIIDCPDVLAARTLVMRAARALDCRHTLLRRILTWTDADSASESPARGSHAR